MLRQWAVWLGIGILSIIILAAFIFTGAARRQPADDAFVVVTTFFPLYDIVRNVTGNEARVVQLVPSGADPHSYTLSPQLIAEAQDADVLFIIGHGIDNHLADALTRIVNVPAVVVDEGIALRAFDEEHTDAHEAEGETEEDEHAPVAGDIDPHYWLTVPNAKLIAATVAREVRQRDPVHADLYAEHAQDYQTTLDALERELQEMSQRAPQRHFIAMHNAWSYFAAHYNLELVATYEPVEGRTPSFQDLQHLTETISQYGITAFYAEPQRVSDAATQFFARELGLTVLTLNAEGAIAPEYSYAQLMRDNMESILAGSTGQ